MPGLSARVEPATETIETVAPELEVRIAALLSTYHDLKFQCDVLGAQLDAEKEKLAVLMREHQHEKIQVNGTTCQMVRGTTSKLDKVKFVQLGGSLKQLEDATVTKPKKPYLLIGKEESHE